MANFPVYVPSGLCVQANVDKACVGHEGVEKACVGCGGSLRTCGITFEMTFTFRSAAKVMSTWQHASLVRLQPHYVYILGSSKGAVTTALQAHSRRQRLIGVKKARSTPSPLQPCLTRCHSPGVVPLPKQKRYLFFLLFCLALLDQRRGYNRVRKSQRTWL